MTRLLLALLFLGGPILLSGQGYSTLATARTKAVKAYHLSVEAGMGLRWEEALRHLEKALKAEPDFIDAYIQQGAVFFDSGRYGQAEGSFGKALELGPDYDPFVWYQLGLSQMRQDKFREAIPSFENFLARAKQGERSLGRARSNLDQCRFSAEAMANPIPFSPVDVGTGINTSAPEYLPSLTADGKTMVFTRLIDRQEDLYYSQYEAEAWGPARPLENINTPYNEGAHTISADGRLLLFTACNLRIGLGSCDLYYSVRKGDRWTPPENLGAPVNSPAWESQPSLSANGRQLFFASNRSGGQGKNDIWVSDRSPNGQWSEPRPVSKAVNTAGHDQSPFIHPDGQTLYFMSDGHQGMGKTDLFYSRRQADGSWAEPENLGFPINTSANEGALVVSLDGQKAYFATDRKDVVRQEVVKGIPNSDIFAFDLYPEARPRPVTYLKARVTDRSSGEVLPARADVLDLENGELYAWSTTDERGEILLCLPAGRNYALNVNKPGYLFFSENFSLADSFSLSRPYELEVALSPIPESPEKVEPVILRNVFFATGSAELLPPSRVELDRLAGLLRDNPDLRIRINGHTDAVGSEEDNLELSTARARSVLNYLVEAGIDSDRLEAKGFGESQPIASNETGEGRRQNRRTEFEVIR